MNTAKRTPIRVKQRAVGSHARPKARAGQRWSVRPQRVTAPAFIGPLWKDGSKVARDVGEPPRIKPACTAVSTQTEAPSDPSKYLTFEEFCAGGESEAKALIKGSLRYRLPESIGCGVIRDIAWTWMGAEYNPEVFGEARVEYRLDPPMSVSAPLYLHNADVEQRYANCVGTLRALADVTESDPISLHHPVAKTIYGLKNGITHAGNWARRLLRTNANAAMREANRRMLRQVAWRGLTDLSSSVHPTTGLHYWVRGEIVGESGISRRSYSVVGERPANWFSGTVKYRRTRRITGELGPCDGVVYHCEELVDYLTRFCEFRSRSVTNVRTLQARAVMWCKEQGIRDEDASVFRAPSVICAMKMIGGEFAAHAEANSTSFGASVTAANALAEGSFLPADDTTLYGLKSLAAVPYVGDIQIWHPTLELYRFGLDEQVPEFAKVLGVPYIGFRRWFRLRQLLTPDVSIPLK